MKKLPFLYEKVLTFLDHAEQKKLDRDRTREEIASRFRLSKSDTNEVFRELHQFGVIRKKNRQKIEL